MSEVLPWITEENQSSNEYVCTVKALNLLLTVGKIKLPCREKATFFAY